MTQRITVSLPDDLAARITAEPNQSGFVADLVRAHVSSETVRDALAAVGINVTDAGRTRARALLRAADHRRAQREPGAALAAIRARLERTASESE